MGTLDCQIILYVGIIKQFNIKVKSLPEIKKQFFILSWIYRAIYVGLWSFRLVFRLSQRFIIKFVSYLKKVRYAACTLVGTEPSPKFYSKPIQ